MLSVATTSHVIVAKKSPPSIDKLFQQYSNITKTSVSINPVFSTTSSLFSRLEDAKFS